MTAASADRVHGNGGDRVHGRRPPRHLQPLVQEYLAHKKQPPPLLTLARAQACAASNRGLGSTLRAVKTVAQYVCVCVRVRETEREHLLLEAGPGRGWGSEREGEGMGF